MESILQKPTLVAGRTTFKAKTVLWEVPYFLWRGQTPTPARA